jgi:cold shock CspA family protein
VITERAGRVVAFDTRRGIGAVEADDGRRFGFHCTRLAGDRRDIAVGTPVWFRVVPGHLGAWEADGLRDTAG